MKYRGLHIALFASRKGFLHWASEIMALWNVLLNYMKGGRTQVPPGVRFDPTDIELILYYLKKKILGKRLRFEAIAEVDIYKFSAWELPGESILESGNFEKSYFFCPLQKKYSTGCRMNRTAKSGFWKVTGNDKDVHDHNGKLVGKVKTLIFHEGKPGVRTNWVMHEYRLEHENLPMGGVVESKYVLCVIYKKEGLGPRNGAQYAPPFKEEDWTEGEEDVHVESGPSADMSTPASVLPAGTSQLSGIVSGSSLSNIVTRDSESLPTVCTDNVSLKESSEVDILSTVLGNNVSPKERPQISGENKVVSAIDCSGVDDTLISTEDGIDKSCGSDGNDFFRDLGDLEDLDCNFSLSDLNIPLDGPFVQPP